MRGSMIVSKVWKYFIKCNDSDAECTLCGRRLKRCGGTSSMRHHINNIHPEIQDIDNKEEKPIKRIKISKISSASSDAPEPSQLDKLSALKKLTNPKTEPSTTTSERVQAPRKSNSTFVNLSPNETEFDLFAKSLAVQLKNMPLHRALLCQERLQKVMTHERIFQLTQHDPLNGNTAPEYDESNETITFTAIQEPNEEYNL